MNVQRKVKSKSNTDAVSPVIGVMLMIVVTIIIAAIVSAFAGGFADQQKKTPSAQIEVTLISAVNSSGLTTPQLIFTHKGGDPVDTRDLKIVATVNGQKHVTDGSLLWSNAATNFNQASFTAGTGSFVTNDGYPCELGSNGSGTGGGCASGGEWGNFTFMNGDILTTNIDNPNTLTDILGSSTIGEWYGKINSRTLAGYHDNGPIIIEIVHIPSGKVISSSQLEYT